MPSFITSTPQRVRPGSGRLLRPTPRRPQATLSAVTRGSANGALSGGVKLSRGASLGGGRAVGRGK